MSQRYHRGPRNTRRGHGSAARTEDPIPPERGVSSARECDGLRRRDLRRECGPAVQRFLHHQGQRHVDRTLDLPLDRGSSRRPAVGHGQCTARGHVSVHPAGERRHCVVRLRPQDVQRTSRPAASSAMVNRYRNGLAVPCPLSRCCGCSAERLMFSNSNATCPRATTHSSSSSAKRGSEPESTCRKAFRI